MIDKYGEHVDACGKVLTDDDLRAILTEHYVDKIWRRGIIIDVTKTSLCTSVAKIWVIKTNEFMVGYGESNVIIYITDLKVLAECTKL